MTDVTMTGRTTPSINARRLSACTPTRRPDADTLLDSETELHLITQWQRHRDSAALDRLVDCYQCLVKKIAARFRASGLPMEDLIAEGNVGLLHAIGKFDCGRGLRLSTYAMWWIRAAISNYALGSSSIVRGIVTDRQKRVFFALRRMKPRADAVLPVETVRALADELNVAPAEVEEVQAWLTSRDASINAPSAGGEDEPGEEWQDRLRDEAPDPEAALMAADEAAKRRAMLDSVLSTLNAREQHIVRTRHLAETPCRLSDLGAHFGITRERVRQIEAAALKKLRRRVREVAEGHGLLCSDIAARH